MTTQSIEFNSFSIKTITIRMFLKEIELDAKLLDEKIRESEIISKHNNQQSTLNYFWFEEMHVVNLLEVDNEDDQITTSEDEP